MLLILSQRIIYGITVVTDSNSIGKAQTVLLKEKEQMGENLFTSTLISSARKTVTSKISAEFASCLRHFH